MEVFSGHQHLTRPLRAPAVAIGNFDGVHLGHQRLMHAAVDEARRLGGEAVVLTFDPHPAKVLAPQLAPPLLTTRPRKLELIAAQGIAATVLEPFTRELAATSPDAFVERLLVGGLGARHVVVGYDFTYGQKRGGTVETLRAAGARLGFGVTVVPAVSVDGLVASSTKVRELLLEGNVVGARTLLGRPFDVDGPVVAGAGRGRTIGIPTANVAVEGEILPRTGVYAVRVRVVDTSEPVRDAIANLGVNPTFVKDGTLSLEAHIFDFTGDLYGKRLRVEFVARLRDERRFASVDELVAQIRRDMDAAREAHETHG